MTFGILLLTLFLFGLLGLNWFMKTDPRRAARRIKSIFGVILLAGAGYLGLRGMWLYALPVGAFALSLFREGFTSAFGADEDGAGRRSTVRSAMFEMELDHGNGDIDGTVLAGNLEGARLSELSQEVLCGMYEDLQDRDSVALLEAYLDRRFPRWREDVHVNDSSGGEAAPRSGGMTAQEAYEILGLSPGAGETEIRNAHRRLIKGVHPDSGGSLFLASRINEARDILLAGRHT